MMMKSTLPPQPRSALAGALLLSTLALPLAACGGGGSGSNPDNRFKAEVITPGGLPAGIVLVDYTMIQRLALPVDVLPEYSTDGGATWQRATGAPGAQILDVATAKDPGVQQTYPWDTRVDGVGVTAAATNVAFRIRPLGSAVVTPSGVFAVDNTTEVVITGLSPEWGVVGQTITITGRRFDPVAANNTVVFGDISGGAIPATPISSTGTTLTVDVPDPTPQPLRDLSGPLTVSTGPQTSNPVQFVATAGGSTHTTVLFPTSVEGNSMPWSGGPGGSVSVQYFFRPAEIGTAGAIDGLRWIPTSFPSPNPNTVTIQNLRVRMAHTSLVEPTSIQDLNYDLGPPKLVADTGPYVVPAGATAAQSIPFFDTFAYNGRDALLVEIEGIDSTGGAYFGDMGRRLETRRIWEFGNGSFGADIIFPALEIDFLDTDTDDSFSTVISSIFSLNLVGPCASILCNPALGFCDMNCEPRSTPRVLPAGAGKVQFVLLARELRQGGTVKGIAWKPPVASAGADYTGLSVSLANFPLNTLTSTFEDAVSTGLTQVRAPAPYTVPAGVGDYVPIPLDLPASFSYNGVDNLLVEISVTGGTGVNPVDGQDIRPSQRFVWATTATATSGSLTTDGVSVRVDFE